MPFVIKSVATGLVLDVKGNNKSSGAEVVMWSHNGGSNQLWEYKNNMIYSKLSGLVLDISGAAQGGPLITFRAHGGSNQKWYFDDDFTIRNGTGMVLDIEGGASSAGARIIGYGKHGGQNQKFRVHPHSK